MEILEEVWRSVVEFYRENETQFQILAFIATTLLVFLARSRSSL